MSQEYDYLIVGAGSAGCVLANRLSTSGASVLLLEAGIDTPPESVPDDIADLYPRSYYNPAYMWRGLNSDGAEHGSRAASPFPQARVMGGGSSLSGMVALRGSPDDYESWGVKKWSWPEVLASFRSVEHDRDFVDAELHGTSGPISIRRHAPEDWPPFSAAVGEASLTRGWPALTDFNGPFVDGFGPLPMSSTLAGRASAASAYLDRATRRRVNLRVSCRTVVARLLFHKTRCVGVETGGTSPERYYARQVIVSAGAIHSPALLMRSGLGPAGQLSTLGVKVVADLPGVGANLQNHAVVYLAAYLAREARQSPNLRPAFNTALRFSSSSQSPGDLQMLVLNKSSWHGLGHAVAGLGVCLMRPESAGRISLRSADPMTPPRIEFRMLAEASDLERLIYGFEVACDLMLDSAVRATRYETFAAGYSGVVRRLNRPGRVNEAVTSFIAKVLDGPTIVRRELIKRAIASGDTDERRLSNPTWRQETVRHRSFGTYHPVGTCRMGSENENAAVTLFDGRVKGIDGLSVIDASIFPTIPRANTNLPVMMAAERCADLIIARDV